MDRHGRTRLVALLITLGMPAFASSAAPDAPVSTVVPAESAGELFEQARALLKGDGVPKDVKKSFALMQAAADQGHADAMGGLGYFYSNGITVPANPQLAAEWFRKGAENGSAKARLNLGKYLIDGKVPSSAPDEARREGVEWVKRAADQGLPEATLAYGSMLYFGDNGISKDYGMAAGYLKSAANSGSPDARNLVGNMCELGLGMPVDPQEARQWFQKAALQGDKKAQANLGRLLGPEVEDRDTRVEAMAWLLIAMMQGETTAEKTLDDAIPGLKEGEMNAAKAKAAELRKQIVVPRK